VVSPPALGSLRDFHVLATVDTVQSTFKRVSARLAYAGQNILIYIDTLAPAGGFTSDQLAGFGQLFDQALYTLDVNTFGPPSDQDGNGGVILLLSPVVNQLTPEAQCASQGYIAGFFDGFDLVSTDTSSNRGEIFYGVVPDPGGRVSCAHSLSAILADVPSVFLHELQHLINFSQHVLVQGGQAERGWLDEGLSLVASELGAVYYDSRFPAPAGRSQPGQLLPDSALDYIGTQVASSYDYLLAPDTVALTFHSDADLGLTWRGGDWLLLRWLGDQKGSGFYRRMEETKLTGIANIEAAAAEPFPSLFGDFGLALATDSLPGVSRGAVPPRDRFATWPLRALFAAFAAPAYPLSPARLQGTVAGQMVPGTAAYYQVNTAVGGPAVEIQFSGPNGSLFPPALHSQVSLFRLPGP
jgi:hypothetical protein